MLLHKPIFFRWLIFPFLLFAFSGLAQTDTLAQALYEEGKNHYYDGRYPEARLKFLEALSQKGTTSGDEQLLNIYLRLGKTEAKLRIHHQALAYYEKGKNLAIDRFGPESEEVADFLFEIGATHSEMYQPEKARKFFEQCLAIYTREHGPESSVAGNMYMNFGIEAIKMAHFRDAETYFLKALDIFQQVSEPESEDFNRIYSNLGYLYRKTGNYERAIEYGTKALEIKLLHYDPNHPSLAKYHRNLARAFEEKGAPERALPYMLRSVEVLERSLGADHPTTAGSYGELGNIYAKLGQYEKALPLYQKANVIQEKTMSPTHPYLVGGYFNIGRLYEDQEDYPKALAYYQEALQRFRSAEYTPLHLVAETQRKIADMFFEDGRTEEAIATIQEAMQSLAPGFLPQSPYENPSIEQLQHPTGLLDLLHSKGFFLEHRYRQQQQPADLEMGFQTLELAVALIEQIKKGYFSEADRQLLNARMTAIYEGAVRTAYELYEQTGEKVYLEKAFSLSEKGKSGILWQSLNAAVALEASGVPPEVLDSLAALQSQIAELKEAQYENADPAAVQALADLKIRYAQQIGRLEAFNSRYYQLKYATPNLQVAELAARLPHARAGLLAYFYDDQHIYLFLIRKDGLQGARVSRQDSLGSYIRKLREDGLGGADSGAYQEALHVLHGLLIQPLAPGVASLDELVIIPYGVLQYLSFEALAPATEERDFRKLAYLVRTHVIQYAWSAEFWLRPPQKTSRLDRKYIGFAPDFSSGIALSDFRMALAALPQSQAEVEHARSLFSGEAFTGAAASESRFLALAPHSRILHLATHALADDADPLRSGLWFAAEGDTLEDGYLSALEIYHLQLAADLAVMSACNTGYGQWEAGEGVMSLGRAFAYAGCKSVLMSLWLANDLSSSSVINRFYDHAAKGLEKHQALRRAKLEYLEEADPLTAHPYFWANLVVVGDMSPLRQNQIPWIWLGAIALAGMIGWGWRKVLGNRFRG